jgi:hypothetical protein
MLNIKIADCHICRHNIALVNGLCQDCYEALNIITKGARPAMNEKSTPYAGWAILELMGHRRLSGFLTEQTIAGAGMIRIDLPATDDHPAATQFYSPAAVYAITPASAETVQQAARLNRPRPVEPWELPQPRQTIVCSECGGETSCLYMVVHGRTYCQSCYDDLDYRDNDGEEVRRMDEDPDVGLVYNADDED